MTCATVWHVDAGLAPRDSDETRTDCSFGSVVAVEGGDAMDTGPPIFWMGEPDVVPSCPVETPYQGLEGYIDDPMLPKLPRYARSASSPRPTIAWPRARPALPLRPDFHVCIHQEGEEGCPLDNDYTDRKTLFDAQVSKTVTLCCRDDSSP